MMDRNVIQTLGGFGLIIASFLAGIKAIDDNRKVDSLEYERTRSAAIGFDAYGKSQTGDVLRTAVTFKQGNRVMAQALCDRRGCTLYSPMVKAP